MSTSAIQPRSNTPPAEQVKPQERPRREPEEPRNSEPAPSQQQEESSRANDDSKVSVKA